MDHPDPQSYVGFIDIPEGQRGDVRVIHEVEPAGKTFSDTSPRSRIYGGQDGQTWEYDVPTRWHRLTDADGTWMTDLPIEQRQMRTAAEFLEGNVLVGGLGLGVLPTILGNSLEVETITVVEQSKEVIALVEPHLVVQRKLIVIQDDLFEFLKRLKRKRVVYDTAFYDIWRGDNESTFHEMVEPLLRLSKASGRIVGRPICWQEDVMRGQLFQGLRTRLDLFTNPALREMQGITSEELWVKLENPDGSVWTDWAVPAWQEMKRRNLLARSDRGLAFLDTYAKRYGDPYALPLGQFGTGQPTTIFTPEELK